MSTHELIHFGQLAIALAIGILVTSSLARFFKSVLQANRIVANRSVRINDILRLATIQKQPKLEDVLREVNNQSLDSVLLKLHHESKIPNWELALILNKYRANQDYYWTTARNGVILNVPQGGIEFTWNSETV